MRLGRRLAIGAALLVSATARADEPSAEARATARELFVQGRALLDEKSYAAACPKFEESQRLDPGGGTLLNLALCHEMIGRTATAWVEFAEALRIAKRDGRSDREDFAREHLDALEPRLSRMRIVVPPSVRVSGLVVVRDGVTLGEAVWGEAVPVDPGGHVIDASAPGKTTAHLEVTIADAPETKVVTLPTLVDVAPPPDATPETPPSPAGRTQRILGIALGGAGVLALGFGTYFGARALDEKSQANDACPSRARCTPDGESHNDSAKSAADVSTVLFASGLTLLGAGAVLFFTAPSSKARAFVDPTKPGALVW